jgi:hypothetical protein
VTTSVVVQAKGGFKQRFFLAEGAEGVVEQHKTQMPPSKALPSTRGPDVVMIPGTCRLEKAMAGQLAGGSYGVGVKTSMAPSLQGADDQVNGAGVALCHLSNSFLKRKSDLGLMSAREELKASQTALSTTVGEAKKLKADNEAISVAAKRWMNKYVEADAKRIETANELVKLVAETEKLRGQCGELEADSKKMKRRLEDAEAKYEQMKGQYDIVSYDLKQSRMTYKDLLAESEKMKLQLEGVRADHETSMREGEARLEKTNAWIGAYNNARVGSERWQQLYEAEVATSEKLRRQDVVKAIDPDDLRGQVRSLTTENIKLRSWLAHTHEEKERFRKSVIELSSPQSFPSVGEFLKTGVLPSDALQSGDMGTPELPNVAMSETQHDVRRAGKAAWLASY